MTTTARHAVRNGRTTVHYTPAASSPTPAVHLPPWHPSDPQAAHRLATHAFKETGEALEAVRRLERRCDRLTAAVVVTAAVAVFAVAAVVFTWGWLL